MKLPAMNNKNGASTNVTMRAASGPNPNPRAR